MAIEFRCPECREEYEVDEAYGGRRWQCPSCSTSFVIPEGGTIPVKRLGDRPRPGRRRYEDEADDLAGAGFAPEAWDTYRTGLRIMNIGVLIFLVPYLLFIFLIVWSAATPRQGFGAAGPLETIGPGIIIVFGLACIVSVIVWLVGQGISCAVPAGFGAKGLTIASLVLTVLGVLAYAVAIVGLATTPRGPFAVQAEPPVFYSVLALFALVFQAVGHVLQVVSLRTVAVRFENHNLGLNTLIYLAFLGVWLVSSVVIAMLLINPFVSGFNRVPFDNLTGGRRVVIVVLMILLAVLTGWFMYLLTATRTTAPAPVQPRRRPGYEDW